VPAIRAGAGAAFVLTATTSGSSIIGTLFLQDEMRLSPGRSGFAFLLLSASVAAASAGAPAVIRRAGTAFAMTAGLAVVAASMVTQAFGVSLRDLPVFLAGLALAGAGLGLASVASTTHGTSGADDSTAGVVGGLLNAAAQVGTAVGIAALLATATTWPEASHGPEAAYGVAALTSLLAMVATAVSGRRHDRTAASPR
jgi:MFS family permease